MRQKYRRSPKSHFMLVTCPMCIHVLPGSMVRLREQKAARASGIQNPMRRLPLPSMMILLQASLAQTSVPPGKIQHYLGNSPHQSLKCARSLLIVTGDFPYLLPNKTQSCRIHSTSWEAPKIPLAWPTSLLRSSNSIRCCSAAASLAALWACRAYG